MSVLRSLERTIEGLFEGVFGRAFRTTVQPVELARKLAKEMDEHRSVSVSRVYVPNEYTLYLSSTDRSQFASYEGSLVGELQEYLSEHARREGYALLTTPRVIMTTDDDLATGEFGIATRVVQADEGPAASISAPPAAVEQPAVTTIYRPEPEPVAAPVVEPPRERVTLSVDDRIVPITGSVAVLGRSRECDVRIDDGNASRRHCEIERLDDGSWVLVDLGSTNGTELNGRRVTRAELGDGDRITIGATDVVFGRTLP